MPEGRQGRLSREVQEDRPPRDGVPVVREMGGEMSGRPETEELIAKAAARMVYVYGYPMLSVCRVMRVGKQTVVKYGVKYGWRKDVKKQQERKERGDAVRDYVRSISDGKDGAEGREAGQEGTR